MKNTAKQIYIKLKSTYQLTNYVRGLLSMIGAMIFVYFEMYKSENLFYFLILVIIFFVDFYITDKLRGEISKTSISWKEYFIYNSILTSIFLGLVYVFKIIFTP